MFGRLCVPMQPDMTTVCAVTVTYGDRFEPFCKETIERALREGVTHLIVVDNGSEPRSAEALAAFSTQDPRVDVIRRSTNAGSAVAFSRALSAALTTDAEFIWILDDDNWVTRGSLDHLLELQRRSAAQYSDNLTAVCASRALNGFHQRIRAGAAVDSVYPSVGAFFSFDTASYLARKARKHHPVTEQFPCIPYAPYGGLLVRAELVQVAGLPFEDLVLYCDDTYWTSGIVGLGHRIVLAKNVVIEDAEGKWLMVNGSGSLTSMLQTDKTARLYLSVRNRVWFDHQRIGTVGQRARYLLNKLVIMTLVGFAGRRRECVNGVALFRQATRDAEASRLGHISKIA